MNRSPIKTFITLLLALLLGTPLVAASLTATYTEEMDTSIATSASFGVGEPNYSLAFHVGTLTIQKIGSGSIETYRPMFVNVPCSLM